MTISIKDIASERLISRELNIDDAPFILELLNEPTWLQFIGDKGVRNLADAKSYIMNGPHKMYRKSAIGLLCVVLQESNTPIGLCGLIKRDTLADIDIGFAFLERFGRNGYAYEAASTTMEYARDILKLSRVVAITNPDNQRSIKLLNKIGLHFERMVKLADDAPELQLLAWNIDS